MSDKEYTSLLEKYYSGKCSDQELVDLFEWINSKEGTNEMDKYLSAQLESIETTGPKSSRLFVDSYKNIQSRIFSSKPKTAFTLHLWKYAVVASMILTIVSFSLYFQSKFDSDPILFSVDKGNKGNMMFADGSKIMMNAESQVRYLAGSKRELNLEGEAYLEVAKDKKHPFTVHTPHLDVVVYGTAFNVVAYSGEPYVKIALVEGSVGLKISGKSALTYIKPGQTAMFNVKTKQFQLFNHVLQDVALWRKEELVLFNAEVSTLTRKLQSWYGMDIYLINQPQKMHLYNMKLRHESIEEVLMLMNEVTPISYLIKGKEVTIRYK